MPVPEMREADTQLLEGLPDATHAPHAREARLREIASVPMRHNKSITENSVSSQVLHEKVCHRAAKGTSWLCPSRSLSLVLRFVTGPTVCTVCQLRKRHRFSAQSSLQSTGYLAC